MLSDFDCIQLTVDALNQENYETALSLLETKKQFSEPEINKLLLKGDHYFHHSQYQAAVIIFEQLYRVFNSDCDRECVRVAASLAPQLRQEQYFNIQRKLVKAYQQNKQQDKAICLCQQLAVSDMEAVRIWGEKFLTILAPESVKQNLTSLSKNQTSTSDNFIPHTPIKSKSLSEFKQYCQNNLLTYLKELEKERQQTLITIIFSGIFCIFGSWFILKLSLLFFSIHDINLLYLYSLPVSISIWLVFCRSCIQVYGLNFKKNIIENIVKFIDRRFDYANGLFLEDQRQTTVAFTHSQLFGKNLREPDSLKQEDCVYGTIGKTDIFMAEIIVQDKAKNYKQATDVDDLVYQKNIFRGLFFEAKFPKKFNQRTFVLPNDLKNRTPLINNWRGQIIKLEDPEFNHIFRVYGDNQVDSRYILSTNLINRLVKFRQKAKRKVYISFIQGYIYIAIPYRHNLFEPKLFTSMLSFAPMKEYFENLQLMLGVVEDLNLNRKIWQ